MYKNILIIADIEGSSGCLNYEASSFLTRPWALACREMSRDADALVKALFDAGAVRVRVKDFHRTGFNIFRELLDPRAESISGYRRGPVPGIGDVDGAEAVFYLGLHAASGTDGFLAHTLTSRLSALRVNGEPMSEIELFSASLSPFGVVPAFFSGCPEACRQAEAAVPGIVTYSIYKSGDPAARDVTAWRRGLAETARKALNHSEARIFTRSGPFHTELVFRDGPAAAANAARRWNLAISADRVVFDAPDMASLYMQLIRICYLTPAIERMLPMGLPLFNLRGYMGSVWARRVLRHSEI